MRICTKQESVLAVSRLVPARTLVGLAWCNVCLHLIALALAVVGMRPGTPAVPLEERLVYLAASPIGWTLGWCAWMLCAVVLVAFLATVTRRLGEGTGLAQLGLTIALIGAAFDLLCDSIYILVLPMLASWPSASEALFLVVEKLTGLASLVIANGAYSVGILLLSVELRQRQAVARWTTAVGYAVAGFGLLLAAAGFTAVPWHVEWATAPTIGLFCVWVLLVAYSPALSGRQP